MILRPQENGRTVWDKSFFAVLSTSSPYSQEKAAVMEDRRGQFKTGLLNCGHSDAGGWTVLCGGCPVIVGCLAPSPTSTNEPVELTPQHHLGCDNQNGLQAVPRVPFETHPRG